MFSAINVKKMNRYPFPIPSSILPVARKKTTGLKRISLFMLLFSQLALFGQVTVRKVKPSDTSPLINTYTADSHYVFLDGGISTPNRLFVFLAGTGGSPKHYTAICSTAAALGYHAIGLEYPNVPTIGGICQNDADPDCFENCRLEIIDGTDRGTGVSVNLQNSILFRLFKVLKYLHQQYPSEGWNQYYAFANLNYDLIAWGGHSQGGGHAAMIGKYYDSDRILCFSSPKDYWTYGANNMPAVWYSNGTWVTPTSKVYGFNHIGDGYLHQMQIWNQMGLNAQGSQVNVDNNASPYSYTHQLITNYNVPSGDEHGSTVSDRKTPVVSSAYVFYPVWYYMLTN